MNRKEGAYLTVATLLLVVIIGFNGFFQTLDLTGRGVLSTPQSNLEAYFTSPKEGSVSSSGEVDIKWRIHDSKKTGYGQERYVMHIDDDLLFNSPEIYVGFEETSKKVKLNDGRYYSRIKLYDTNGGEAKWSKTFVFSVNKGYNACEDGTEFNECSDTKPLFCNQVDGGKLQQNCEECGCPEEGFCQKDGSCIVAKVSGAVCEDGTLAGECSDKKPLYCNEEGVLIEASVVCGCPAGTVAVGGTGCEIKIESPKAPENLFARWFRELFKI
ncbi:MAG: hypothetical protein HYS32_02605 [Candidatus Woesearchaeota archaeon]|nr:MAG: hypothetical protein HYS32_02605 [Candidatus Woesearchaeota archaeon]